MAKNSFLDLRLFLTLTLISLLIFLFDSLGFLTLPKSYLQRLTLPIQYGLYKSSLFWGKQWEFIIVSRRSAQENKALRHQLGELLTKNAKLEKYLKETETQLRQYQKLSPQTYDLLPARVVGISRYLLIDKGFLDGVAPDQVVVYEDSFIGKVKDTSPYAAKVLLSRDPDSKIAVYSQGSFGRAKGILTGQFGSEGLMDKILHQETVEIGDVVYSEGSEGKLPRGLLMGQVTEVLERQNEVFKQAKVIPNFDVNELDLVFVMRNP